MIMNVLNTGLEIRVVLWPQSTNTYAGQPDSDVWWSGGLLKKLTIKEQYFDNFNWHRYLLCLHICFINFYVWQGQ